MRYFAKNRGGRLLQTSSSKGVKGKEPDWIRLVTRGKKPVAIKPRVFYIEHSIKVLNRFGDGLVEYFEGDVDVFFGQDERR